ncbi:MAG: hypothetical protein IH874_07105 [Candidatus Dadabacteria bacterium]|nr:hypothetical protein [Candidatus Dadabacteria bacterium]
MRLFVVVLALATVALYFYGNTAVAADLGLTPSQKHFTAIIRGLPGVSHTEWKTPISLYVRTTSKAVGYPPKNHVAQKLADALAERGRTALRQPFCVHIMYTKDKRLAKSCVY